MSAAATASRLPVDLGSFMHALGMASGVARAWQMRHVAEQLDAIALPIVVGGNPTREQWHEIVMQLANWCGLTDGPHLADMRTALDRALALARDFERGGPLEAWFCPHCEARWTGGFESTCPRGPHRLGLAE